MLDFCFHFWYICKVNKWLRNSMLCVCVFYQMWFLQYVTERRAWVNGMFECVCVCVCERENKCDDVPVCDSHAHECSCLIAKQTMRSVSHGEWWPSVNAAYCVQQGISETLGASSLWWYRSVYHVLTKRDWFVSFFSFLFFFFVFVFVVVASRWVFVWIVAIARKHEHCVLYCIQAGPWSVCLACGWLLLRRCSVD